MAAAITLTAGVANSAQPTPQQLANAPFTSDPTWANMFSLTWALGTSATAQMTPAQVSLNPVIYMAKTSITAANTITLNLPSPTTCRGSRVKIVQRNAAQADSLFAITCTGGALFSGALVNNNGVVGNAAALTTIGFTVLSAIGDEVGLQSDGVKWNVRGLSSVVGFTFA